MFGTDLIQAINLPYDHALTPFELPHSTGDIQARDHILNMVNAETVSAILMAIFGLQDNSTLAA